MTTLRDDGRTFQELRRPVVNFQDNILSYKATDTTIFITSTPSNYLSFRIEFSPTLQLSVPLIRNFIEMSLQTASMLTIKITISDADRAIPAHVLNAVFAYCAAAGISSNGAVAVGICGQSIDGPDANVFYSEGSGKSYIFGEKISGGEVREVMEILRTKCAEVRIVLKEVMQ
ncbi:hypothetical protein SS50377_27429 [Spironucleus salmonicida]|uniref:Uncharacterized protein n=1 Tax=Spironucleus salmonicida TaxID=348837 RepID=V6LHV7_9EUKA|nr:hypothetical protein SS50377_27429 [Spironucleus salmonicida]|eukprot:EST43281.1 Hypothetical protein SS50377_16945 [Spironucleus salmonicida]